MRVTVLLVLSVLLAGCLNDEPQPTAGPTVCFETDDCVVVEIADEPTEKSMGLMNREGLAPDSGMLFVFENVVSPSFWMKNMRFPIDIIWITSDGLIVHIDLDAPLCQAEPCSVYSPKKPVSYVLEVSANYTIEHGITVGSKVDIRV